MTFFFVCRILGLIILTGLINIMERFNETELIERFEKAGGSWLHSKQFNYPSYDGSHLSKQGAEHFSRNLANELNRLLDEKKIQ